MTTRSSSNPSGRRFRYGSVIAALVVAVAACGGSEPKSAASSTTTTSANGVDPNAPEVVAPGDIPDSQVFVPYTTAAYTVSVPEGWSQSIAGATTTFSDHFNTIRLESTAQPTEPTVATVQATEIPVLRRTVSHFALVNVKTVNRPAGPGVLVTYRAASDPDPVTGKRVAIDVERYIFWHNGARVTMTLSGARGSDNVDPWKTVTTSLRWPT